MRKIHLLLCFLNAYITSTAYAASILPGPSLGVCFKLALSEWVLPKDVRGCMTAIPFTEEKRKNILDVVTKTLAFHASTNYQLQAPKPFDKDVQWDLLGDLEEMRTRSYSSDLEFHIDVQQSLKQVNDGHLMYANGCYDGVYVTYNPFPLVLLTDPSDGSQAIYISPSAHEIASTLFGKEVKFWEDDLKRPLEEFSGARVIRINGENPFFAVNANAKRTGRFQGLSSRQNAFFSTTVRGDKDWNYRLGDFAEQAFPILDSVDLTIQRVGSDVEETITVQYRSKFNGGTRFKLINRFAYQKMFCDATKETNGRDWYNMLAKGSQPFPEPACQTVDVKPTEVVLPESLTPSLSPLEESYRSTQFYALEDKTGVLVMGNFGDLNEFTMKCKLFKGLQKLRQMGAEKLIIDLTGNPGGFVCVAHFLHRLLFGETEKTSPQPGLDTTIRMTDIAQRIVKGVPRVHDPNAAILYNREWRNATHLVIEDREWFNPATKITINKHQDIFSQRLGRECDVSSTICGNTESLGKDPLFKAENIILLSDGRCGSSCALFSILLAKKHSVQTVVVGGKSDVPQQYCGFVGGESVTFQEIDRSLKTVKLKKKRGTNSPDIPPDFIVNAKMTVTWRLAYGVVNPNEPEEWQDHAATTNFPLTANIANKPQEIWEAVSRNVFPITPKPQPIFQVQHP